MTVLRTGTICRVVGDLFYQVLLDDDVVCCFVTSEAVDVTADVAAPTGPLPKAPFPVYRPSAR
ncbi:hypothetical protein [uncultured Ralstonia sp.]|jgi:hypothetical protein|uniref:hypothetical protein n=1 Tax=Ralstonia sp. TaxID=54061 RepID=UPI0025DDDF41|nr:hypothetical protein [uncultured Ralstonia sp.]